MGGAHGGARTSTTTTMRELRDTPAHDDASVGERIMAFMVVHDLIDTLALVAHARTTNTHEHHASRAGLFGTYHQTYTIRAPYGGGWGGGGVSTHH